MHVLVRRLKSIVTVFHKERVNPTDPHSGMDGAGPLKLSLGWTDPSSWTVAVLRTIQLSRTQL
jgi:hypothetical protein